jgi:hypothetical protein
LFFYGATSRSDSCRKIARHPVTVRGRPILNERFYEKVIKIKADVAALLNLFSDVSIDVRG